MRDLVTNAIMKAIVEYGVSLSALLEHCLRSDTSTERERDPDEYERGLVATLVEVVCDRSLVVSLRIVTKALRSL